MLLCGEDKEEQDGTKTATDTIHEGKCGALRFASFGHDDRWLFEGVASSLLLLDGFCFRILRGCAGLAPLVEFINDLFAAVGLQT